jgi:MYXO-CTERM domain-containing protein
VTLLAKNGAGAAVQEFEVEVTCATVEPPSGCGCHTGQGAEGLLGALGLALLTWRSQRRTSARRG